MPPMRSPQRWRCAHAAERFNQGQPDRPVALKIGIHHGAAIAVTLNDELDYFGQTVNIAARVASDGGRAGNLHHGRGARTYPGVKPLLAGLPTRTTAAEFRGVGRPMPVITVGAGSAG